MQPRLELQLELLAQRTAAETGPITAVCYLPLLHCGVIHAYAAFRFSTSSGSWPRDPNFQNKMMRTAAATAAAPPP